MPLPDWVRSLAEPPSQDIEHQPSALFSAIDFVVLALYSAILAFAIHQHLPSVDEAQAWLIARDSSLGNILLRQLHYEGAPALWHIILFCATRLHLPYAAMNYLGGSFALAGVFLLVRYSPFPPILRWLLPFTYFLQYQYAVIARPYVLFGLLTFILCLLYPLARPRPVLFAFVAGLLANLSFHAAVFACLFWLLYLRQLLRSARQGQPHSQPRARLATAVAVFVVLAFCSAAVAFPAPGVVLAGDSSHGMSTSNALLNRLVPPETLPTAAPPLDPPIDFNSYSTAKLARTSTVAKKPSRIVSVFAKAILFGADALCYPIARSNWLAVPVLLFFFLWLRDRRVLLLALPLLITVVISVQLFVLDHHTGQFLLALIATAWLALVTPEARNAKAPILSTLLLVTVLVAVVLQIGWTFRVIRFESTHPYDPGRDTAAFLAHELPGKRIAGFAYESTSAQPYAPANIFFNQPSSYWHWAAATYVDRRRTEAALGHPDAIVVGDIISGNESMYNQWGSFVKPGERPYQPMIQYWEQRGFHLTRSFCGERFVRTGISDTFCERILEPTAPLR